MSEKPAHVLEIPDSLGRDIDKGLQPPIESFLSDDALQQQWDATQASSEPVHAENLIPVSRQSADAFTQSALDSGTLPKVSTRRVIPAPFRRDRVTGASHHGKQWFDLRAYQVRTGDIMPDVGLVTDRKSTVRHQPRSAVLGQDPVPGEALVATGVDVAVRGLGGVEKVFDAGASVRVFRKP